MAMTAQTKSILTDTHVVNRFINFYIIKKLWMYYKYPMSELRAIFFGVNKGSKVTGKTKYDNVLSLKPVDIDADKLSKLTGLHKDYFTGYQYINIDELIRDDWIDYLKARIASKGKYTKEKDICRATIENAIDKMMPKSNTKGLVFATACYFARNKSADTSDPNGDRVDEILRLVREFTKHDLVALHKMEKLERYRDQLQKHINHINATIILSEL